MLAESILHCQSPPRPNWRTELAQAFTDASALLAALELDPARVPGLEQSPPGFRLLVPRSFAALMVAGDPLDPLLRQVLPLAAERLPAPGFVPDPVGDAAARRGPALLQKYQGRALLIAHGGCAVHCRYCFRRHFQYGGAGVVSTRLEAAVEAIARDDSIHEAILSGGDPLLLDDAVLGWLVDALCNVAHLRRLRVHTRMPVVLPSRVTDGLCRLLGTTRLGTSVVIHANHPKELSAGCAEGLARLRAAGVTLLNQSVLLSGVNDRVETLAILSEDLFQLGVVPYYLHQLDPVEGAAHFEVDDRRALEIHETLRRRLPGYLLPRLVREVPGAAAKVSLSPVSAQGVS